MKKPTLFYLIFISFSTFSQCVKCNSIEEALKDVTIVKSIQINPYLGGELDEIPTSIGDFVNLEELFLTDLGLTKIPNEIGKLKNLKSLSFAGNNLEELPEEIFKLENLKELILFSNEFSDEYKQNIKNKLSKKVKLMIN